MPTYDHQCESCSHEWEEVYKMADPIPDVCPNCKTKGKVKRLISWVAGTVKLTGRENVQKQWEDGKKIAREAKKNENLLANIVGEEKYHQKELTRDRKKG